MEKIQTVKQLKATFPELVRQIEDRVLETLGVESQKRQTFTEEETTRLTDEERSKVRLQARIMAGI